MSDVERKASIASLLDTGPLPFEDRSVVVLLAAVVAGPKHAADALEGLHDRAAPPEEALEIVLQAYLFAGFPRCINALTSYRATFGADTPGDTTGPATTELLDAWRHRGRELFTRIYDEHTNIVLDGLDAAFGDLRDWILVEAYGKILARPALDARRRELAACAALIVSGDTRQLSSHMRGALHCGAAASDVRAAVEIAAAFARPNDVDRARDIADRILP